MFCLIEAEQSLHVRVRACGALADSGIDANKRRDLEVADREFDRLAFDAHDVLDVRGRLPDRVSDTALEQEAGPGPDPLRMRVGRWNRGVGKGLDALRRADHDTGAKPVVRAHASAAGDVVVDDEGAFTDIDTVNDYQRVAPRAIRPE